MKVPQNNQMEKQQKERIKMNHQKFAELGFDSFQQYRFPNIINVSVVRGDCPCQCVHCPVGMTQPNERHNNFGQTFMSISLFKKIIQEMSAFPHGTLRIHGVGEPILWRELPDALKFAFEKNVRTWLFTCLVTENHSLLKELANYCNIIEISINSIDEDDYKKTKGINAFNKVKKNIELLRSYAWGTNCSPRIIVSRVESENKAYDSEFVSYWKNSTFVDDVFIRTYHDYNTMLENKFNRIREEIIPCLVHWNRFNIDCDGTAILCFNEFFKNEKPDESLLLGNIESNSIEEIWHSDKLNLIREAQLLKDYSIVESAQKLPCVSCTSCQPSGQKTSTSEHQVELFMKKGRHE